MPRRNTLFFVSVWLFTVLLLAGFIAAIRYVLVARPVVRAEGENSLSAIFSNTMSANKSKPTATSKLKSANFYVALESALKTRERLTEDLYDSQNPISKRVLKDYGAMFLAHSSVLPPPHCIFADADSVSRFQNEADILAADFDGVTIELQRAAMTALLAARRETQAAGFDVTPRDGAEAARRSFGDTLRLWNSRFLPALAHWTERGRITLSETKRLKNLPLQEQITAVLALEKTGVFFSKDFSKSILYSVAAPGASQHLSLLAFDANEFREPRVREILARHGWFRTVQNDLPHFTFLGYQENELPALGLKKLETADGEFWIPNV